VRHSTSDRVATSLFLSCHEEYTCAPSPLGATERRPWASAGAGIGLDDRKLGPEMLESTDLDCSESRAAASTASKKSAPGHITFMRKGYGES